MAHLQSPILMVKSQQPSGICTSLIRVKAQDGWLRPEKAQSWLPTGLPPCKARIDCPQNLPKVAQNSAPPKKNVCFVNMFVTINMHNFSLVIWCPSFEPLPKWGAMKSPNEGRPHDAPKRIPLRSALSTVDRLTPNRTSDRPPPGISGGFSPCRMYVCIWANYNNSLI